MKILGFVSLIAVMMLTVTSASAVTYRNDGTSSTPVRNKHGNMEMLFPGGTIETHYYLDLTATQYQNLTKVSDEPYAQSALKSDVVAAGETTSVNLSADYLSFKVLTGTVSVFTQSASNTPAILTDWTTDNGTFVFKYDRTYDALEVTGSGTIRIVQYKTSY